MSIRRRCRPRRKGNVLVFTAAMMVALFGMLAFAVDVGYLTVVRSELQRSADAAALAAGWELIDEDVLAGNDDPTQSIDSARTVAAEYVGSNRVAAGTTALAYEDVEIGEIADPLASTQMTFTDASRYNAVRVRVRRTSDQNGAVALFFARVLGIPSAERQAEATSVFLNNLRGFQAPSSGQNLGMLPFALDEQTWNELLDGIGDDRWTWDEETATLSPRADGILEANLYPEGSDDLPPGNRGTVDIGENNNSTSDIARQILHGISPADLAAMGGPLELDENGELFLNGDTGISAGIKDELKSIRGQPRILPIFREVTGPGNNAMYTIVGFAGVRIMDVYLRGKMNGKRVIIQPALVKTLGGIQDNTGELKSDFVYSPVRLIQ